MFDGLLRESPITPTAPPVAFSSSCSAKFGEPSSNFPLAQLMLKTTGNFAPFVSPGMSPVPKFGLPQPPGLP